MQIQAASPLKALEPRLRTLLPAALYAAAWVDPSPETLERVFEHLRTLQRSLYDHVPRDLAQAAPEPGSLRYTWVEGTLMFTDLRGFTPLMSAHAALGSAGGATLLTILNDYFGTILEIVSKAGGNLLEFTGDALLIQFHPDQVPDDALYAVRAGLRMQRAMRRFQTIKTPGGEFALQMRIGIHSGRYLTADVGTPLRMEHVLLGTTVQRTKQAEGHGVPGRVNVSGMAYARLRDQFGFAPNGSDHWLVVDDVPDDQLGDWDLAWGNRLPSMLLLDRSVPSLVRAIEGALAIVEPLASYQPLGVLRLLVENAAKRQIPPDFAELTVMFVSLIGLPDAADHLKDGEEPLVAGLFARVFALINAVVEAHGGVLKKVTYHLNGSDALIFFGVPTSHTDDPLRAAAVATEINRLIQGIAPVHLQTRQVRVRCQIGMARGPVFAAEIGAARGRREFNVLGDSVNVAARLMHHAAANQILITEDVYQAIREHFDCEELGPIPIKGKADPLLLYILIGELNGDLDDPPEDTAAITPDDPPTDATPTASAKPAGPPPESPPNQNAESDQAVDHGDAPAPPQTTLDPSVDATVDAAVDAAMDTIDAPKVDTPAINAPATPDSPRDDLANGATSDQSAGSA
ncbi:MAG: adenylate/guanylate cyclase domain-containing protein [Chloroflexi bacterium]|nr:adenylate/guanylate cyclase domain-containing protein [Chloroflexota bacterium]